MKSWVKLTLLLTFVGFVTGACGVALVRPVTVDSHKRPAFSTKKINRVAVLESSTKRDSSAAADIMTLRLLDNGFNVIERSRIKDVLQESNIKLSHDEDIGGAKRLGDILGADSIIITSISDITTGQQMIPGSCGRKARIESVVSMGVTARLIDIMTSEVIWFGAASTQDKSLQTCLTRMSDELIASIMQ